jgi:alpha-tubulin suppressor-like RCC1 family protein
MAGLRKRRAKMFGTGTLVAVAATVVLAAVAGRAGADPLCGFSQVSAGEVHTCGIRSDGTVECWGFNDYRQSSPPSGAFSQVSAGLYHTCGLRSDGTVACWGDDDDGQSSPPSGTFTQVSAGDYHTCGIRSDGTVECWGANWAGQSSPPSGAFSQVSTGGGPTPAGFAATARWSAGVTIILAKPRLHPVRLRK